MAELFKSKLQMQATVAEVEDLCVALAEVKDLTLQRATLNP